ncbi:hydrolase activity protein [[Candida] boidinii]|nr:hydrolase activity protein [[Candida] boidinii]OWB61079.1 hydrolase activity protein [[Candida] boidinii]OWB76589.1 hydrolase activity protein [[Candida] boidinii]
MSQLIKYTSGDLFQVALKTTSIKEGPIIIGHACNCLGFWGSGIAPIFKRKFPSTYKIYKNHCAKYSKDPSLLLGSSLVIPISVKDPGFVKTVGERVLIVCLFTSVMGGEDPEEIAENTEAALFDLKKRLETFEIEGDFTEYDSNNLATLNIPKINAGIFNVPWELTEKSIIKSGLKTNVFVL